MQSHFTEPTYIRTYIPLLLKMRKASSKAFYIFRKLLQKKLSASSKEAFRFSIEAFWFAAKLSRKRKSGKTFQRAAVSLFKTRTVVCSGRGDSKYHVCKINYEYERYETCTKTSSLLVDWPVSCIWEDCIGHVCVCLFVNSKQNALHCWASLSKQKSSSKQWHEGEKSNNSVSCCFCTYTYDLCNPSRRRMCTWRVFALIWSPMPRQLALFHNIMCTYVCKYYL